MGPWSDAEIDAALGEIEFERRSVVSARLRDIDRLLRGVASLLDCGFQYEARGSQLESAWHGLAACLDARRTIANEDGSTSNGSLGAEVTIERLPGDITRWLVWAHIGANCNRRQCPEDPHVLLHEESEAGSAEDAVDLAVEMATHLVNWLRSRAPDGLGYFVHR